MPTEVILGRGMPSENRATSARINREFRELESSDQSKALARRFAKKLGFSTEEEYIATLPKIGRRPREFSGRLEIPAVPVIVETRLALPELLDIVGIPSFFDPQEVEDWREGGFETPKEPYITYLTYLPNISVQEVRANLGKYKRGGTVLEGITFYHKRPQILNHYSLKHPGSQIGSDYAPFLSALPNPESPDPRRESRPNHPSLNRGSIDTKSPRFACLIASRI